MSGAITAEDLTARLAGLEDIGRTDRGFTRLAWTAEDDAARAWFTSQAAGLGRTTERDPAGNLWAPPPDARPPYWAIGSHLDSVRSGGRYDGPLGVAAAFAIAERATRAPVAVISFADEEGARFNTPTFGSKALAGALPPDVLKREDDSGVTLGDALTSAGLDPKRLPDAETWRDRLKGFLELHIDQTTDLARADEPYGVVTGLAARARLQVDITGRADHAGTTPPDERRDALSAAAHLIVAAEEAATEGLRVTASRMHIEPNALTTIAAFVRLWLDARARDEHAIDAWLSRVEAAAGDAVLTVASRSPAVAFDESIRSAISAPQLVCFAGHDAGVLQGAGIPAGMVFVRNPTGVSHSPDEHVDLDDAARAATAMLDALEGRLK